MYYETDRQRLSQDGTIYANGYIKDDEVSSFLHPVVLCDEVLQQNF